MYTWDNVDVRDEMMRLGVVGTHRFEKGIYSGYLEI
jgi:hypothetical protein